MKLEQNEKASTGKLFFASVCKELERCDLKRRIRNCQKPEFVSNADNVLKGAKELQKSNESTSERTGRVGDVVG